MGCNVNYTVCTMSINVWQQIHVCRSEKVVCFSVHYFLNRGGPGHTFHPHHLSLPRRALWCASHSFCGKALNRCLKKIKLVEQGVRRNVVNTKRGVKMAVLLHAHPQCLLSGSSGLWENKVCLPFIFRIFWLKAML